MASKCPTLMVSIPVYMFLTCGCLSEFMFRTLDCNTSDILSRSARPPQNNRERTSPSGAAVPSRGRGCGRRPSPTCSASASSATPMMGMTGRNASRQSGWLQPLSAPKHSSGEDKHSFTLCHDCALLRESPNLGRLIFRHATHTHTR